MLYIVKIPFVTLNRSYSTGEQVADVDDAKNLVAAGILEPVAESVSVETVEAGEPEAQPEPAPKKRGKK